MTSPINVELIFGGYDFVQPTTPRARPSSITEKYNSIANDSFRSLSSSPSVPADLNKYAIQLDNSFLSKTRITGQDFNVSDDDDSDLQTNTETDSLKYYKTLHLKQRAKEREPVLEGYSTMHLSNCPLDDDEQDNFGRILLLIGNSLKTSRYLPPSYFPSPCSSPLSSASASPQDSHQSDSHQVFLEPSSYLSDVSKS